MSEGEKSMNFFIKKDYYKILDINSYATPEQIKAAYRKLAKEFHPDLHANNPLASLAGEKFKEINEAYEVLSDQTKKKQYDQARQENNNNQETSSNSNETKRDDERSKEKYKKHEENRNNKQNNDFNNRAKDDTTYTRESINRDKRNAYRKKQRFKNRVKTEENCKYHKDREGVGRCLICNVSLCEECISIFDNPICPKCLDKNNHAYIRVLKMPVLISGLSIIIGAFTGVTLGRKYNILEDGGFFEGIFASTYLLCIWLYLWYIVPTLERFLYKIFNAIFYFLDLSHELMILLLDTIIIVFGITFGWILGFIIGFVKLKRDLIAYIRYRPEYIKTKKFIKQHFKI